MDLSEQSVRGITAMRPFKQEMKRLFEPASTTKKLSWKFMEITEHDCNVEGELKESTLDH